MLTQLKLRASEENLVLRPGEINYDVVKGAIKSFKFHFPSVRIVGCHFLSQKRYIRNYVNLDLRHVNSCSKFRLKVRMLISLPFLMP